MRIADLKLHTVAPTPRTVWTFLELALEDGRTGWGECTLGGQETLLAAGGRLLAEEVRGRDVRDRALLPGIIPHAPAGRVRHTLISALEQAAWDLLGQEAGQPIARLLGGARRDPIPLYANINRGAQRVPAGFAASAEAAVAAGFRAVKLAPFDPFVWQDASGPGIGAAVGLGLARVAAVREAVGPDIDVLVDCHWRFSPGAAAALIRELAPFNLYWLECPVAEANLPEIRRLRSLANDRGMRLAGAETQAGLAGYRQIIEAGAYDVLMPDVKHAGGHAEILHIAALAETAGVEIAPHNPTGPICHAHSLHLSATLSNFLRLEVQFNETPVFFDLVRGASLAFRDGAGAVPPGPGLGVALDPATVAAHAATGGQPVWIDPRLG